MAEGTSTKKAAKGKIAHEIGLLALANVHLEGLALSTTVADVR